MCAAARRNKRCDVIMSRCHAFDSMLDAMLAVPAVANSRYLRYFLNVDDHTRRVRRRVL